MSIRTTGRSGRSQRRTQSAGAAAQNQYNERPSAPAGEVKGRRRFFDIVVVLVAALLIFTLARSIGSTRTNAPASTAAAGGSNAVAATGSHIVITEIMPANKGVLCSSDGNYYDWIEVYNPTDKAVNLQGYSLSDKVKKPTAFVFPSMMLEPGKFVVVFASGLKASEVKDAAELHASFSISSAGGETVLLSDPNGKELQAVAMPAVGNNMTYASDMASTEKWSIRDKPSPGFPNTNEGSAAYLETRHVEGSAVFINEVMPGNKSVNQDKDGDYTDWVELYNNSDQEVDLKGWGLGKSEIDPKEWIFPEVKLAPKQYLVVYLSGKNRTDPADQLHANFSIATYKDTLLLSNLSGMIVSLVQINAQKDDTSYGLIPGTDKWQTFTHPTPGQANTEDGFNALQPSLYAGADQQPVIISEVMSGNATTLKDEQNNDYPSWIELYNQSDKAVNLKDWGLSNKGNEPGRWKFPALTLQAGEYLIVYADELNLTDEDAVAKKKLHTDFDLKLDGGVILLSKPDGTLADRCLLPALQSDMTYGRPQGSISYEYITQPTPGSANAKGYPGFAPDPIFSLKAGQYDDAQQVELTTYDSKDEIHYTLDSTTPTQSSSSYSGPLALDKTTVVRATAYRQGYLPSRAVAATYLIKENINLPIVSIVSDPKNLFDEQTGIYANGPGWTKDFPHKGANFWKRWEKPAHVEVIENDGTVGVSQDFGLRIYGQYSRGNDQKSFALIARNVYGKNSFDYPLFPDQPHTKYKSFIVRNSAQDANMSRIRTALITSLAAETSNVDLQANRQCIVYVNGQFWGVYDMMEKITEHFVGQNHNVDPDRVDMLEGNGAVMNGSNKEYKDLITYVKSHDLSVQENYDYVASKVDIDNYIDWVALEIYTVNSDLGNVRFWKPQTPDGKWRWILYDLDWGFFFANQEKYASYQDSFSKFLNPKGNGVGQSFDNSLILGLLKNEQFKQKFIQRFVYHCTVTFETEHVLQRIDELVGNIEPYMARDKEKWSTGTVERWKSSQIELLKTFARIRPEMNLFYMQKYFNLSNEDMQKLTGK